MQSQIKLGLAKLLTATCALGICSGCSTIREDTQNLEYQPNLSVISKEAMNLPNEVMVDYLMWKMQERK
jgi:hypothetical protein